MEIQQATAFIVLAEELHFGRAARRMFITQPALSRMIKNLEHELGHVLFARNTRQVELTPVGEGLIGPARDFLHAHERAVARVEQTSLGQSGKVSVGFAGASSHLVIAALVRRVQERFPGIAMALNSANFADTGLRKLQDGDLDLSLGRWPTVPRTLDTHLWTEERFVIALPTTHRVAHRSSVSFREIERERFIVFPDPPGSELNDRLDTLCARREITPRSRLTSPDTWTTLALISAGAGIALTFTTVKENVQFPGVVFVDLEDDLVPTHLSFAWKHSSHNPALAAVLECVREISQGANRQSP